MVLVLTVGQIKQEIIKLDVYKRQGFTELDYKTAGFHGSDLILIAARPAMGKSAFALNLSLIHIQMCIRDRSKVEFPVWTEKKTGNTTQDDIKWYAAKSVEMCIRDR